MYLKWRQRLDLEPSLKDFSFWPYLSSESLDGEKRSGFLRNRRLAASVLAGQSLTSVAAKQNVSVSMVSRLMSRCLSGEDIDRPPLTYGLVPSAHLKQHQRRQTLPELTNSKGNSCAFSALLRDVPNLKKNLQEMIQANIDDKQYSQNIKPQSFHSEFKRALEEAHWPKDRYPYTTESMAYQSVRNYMYKCHSEKLAEKLLKDENPTRITSSYLENNRALRSIQIDEHTVDTHSSIHLSLNDELIPLRISRISAIVGADVATTCNLGYTLALTLHPNQQEMLILLDKIICPSPLLTLTTPGFNYCPGADFPVNNLDGFPISFGHVQLDNALMHLANTVSSAICDQQGGTLNLGLPKTPKTRNWIEVAFAYINQHAMHRFSATTGSHTQDPIRESRKNAKRIPNVSFRTIDEALSIVLTQHNVTPQGQIGSATPLELFNHHYRNHYIRYTPELLRKSWSPFIRRMNISIKWLQLENRAPHINFYGVRYKGEGLLKAVLKSRNIIVEYDIRDIRSLHAYSEKAVDFGKLYAPKSWQRFPHSLATRQIINKLVKAHRLSAIDPLAAYFKWILDHKETPKQALQLLKVYLEYTSNTQKGLIIDSQVSDLDSNVVATDNRQNKIRWSLNIADHKE